MSQKATPLNIPRDQGPPALIAHPRIVARSRPQEPLPQDQRVDMLREILLTLVRRDGRDLTARQLSAFLIVYTEDEVQTVSSLAERMNISRPGVTRVMDRLVEFDLLSREEDRVDRRRVLARRTARGATFYRDLGAIAWTAAEGRLEATVSPATTPARRARS